MLFSKKSSRVAVAPLTVVNLNIARSPNASLASPDRFSTDTYDFPPAPAPLSTPKRQGIASKLRSLASPKTSPIASPTLNAPNTPKPFDKMSKKELIAYIAQQNIERSADQKTIGILNGQIRSLEIAKYKQDDDLKMLSERAEAAEKLVEEKDLVIQGFEANVSRLEREKLVQSKKARECAEDAWEKGAMIRKKEAEIIQVKGERDVALKQVKELKNKQIGAAKLREERDAAVKQAQELQQQKITSDRTVKALKNGKGAAEGSVTVLKSEKEALESKVKQLEDKNEVLKLEMTQKDSTLSYLEAERDDAKLEVKELTAALDETQKKEKENLLEVDNLRFENEQLKEQLTRTSTLEPGNNTLQPDTSGMELSGFRPSFRARLAADIAELEERERLEHEEETKRRVHEEVQKELERQYEEMQAIASVLQGSPFLTETLEEDDDDYNDYGPVDRDMGGDDWGGQGEITLANPERSYIKEAKPPPALRKSRIPKRVVK